MVHIRPGDRMGKPCLEVFECELNTSIKELKQKVIYIIDILSSRLKNYSSQ